MDTQGLSHTPVMFDYEAESSENLKYMPMIVRFHLDRVGLRMSLAQWQALPMVDREGLTRFPAVEEAGLDARFVQTVASLLQTHGGAEPERIEPDPLPVWRETAVVPEALLRHSAQAGLTVPTVAQWAAFSPLQRYVLVKLTRKSTPSHDFGAAMTEFGLGA